MFQRWFFHMLALTVGSDVAVKYFLQQNVSVIVRSTQHKRMLEAELKQQRGTVPQMEKSFFCCGKTLLLLLVLLE